MKLRPGSIWYRIISMCKRHHLFRKRRVYIKKRTYPHIKNEYLKASRGRVELEFATPEQLSSVREKVLRNRRKVNFRFAILLCIALPLITFGLFKSFRNFDIGLPPPKQEVSELRIQKQKEDKFLFLLTDGDQWLEKRDWYNSIFQYKKALELFPNEFSANYRLTVAYSYKCQYDFSDCDTGKKLLDKLEKEFPEDLKIREVKAVFEHWGE